jgi:phosphoglycolate phosphatase
MVEARRVALIFDMDNTLIGSRIDFGAIRRSLITLLRAVGAVSESDEALLRRALAELVAIGVGHDRAHSTTLARQMWEIIEAHEADGLRDAAPLDGAHEALDALQAQGFRIAILTNSGRAAALDALRAAGLIGRTEVVVARDDVRALKPAGDGVGEASRLLGSVDRLYVIGDSWIDGAAAAQAGARFIAYRRTAEELKDRGVHPWRSVTRLVELLDLDLTR